MTEQAVIDLSARAAWLAIKLAAPALVATLVVGMIVSIFQAATQISEQTLAFIPKILAMTAALVICGPWLLSTMVDFTVELIKSIPAWVH
jgi:flagellar biosynthetic protein FliQ